MRAHLSSLSHHLATIRLKSDRLSWNMIQAADLFGPGRTAKCALSDFNAEPLCSLRDSAVILILGGS